MLNIVLNKVEVRILGCLLEKEAATPDYYPLTLNGLITACNQKSNRYPVISLDEKTVVKAIESLQEKNLVYRLGGTNFRVPKYEHRLAKAYNFTEKDLAPLCVLMLRGPQTIGEIRGRTERLYHFQDLEEVESALDSLINREDGPWLRKLPRQPGRKEARFTHLLCGELEQEALEETSDVKLERTTLEVIGENERIAKLEKKVVELETRLEGLSQDFIKFKGQFD